VFLIQNKISCGVPPVSLSLRARPTHQRAASTWHTMRRTRLTRRAPRPRHKGVGPTAPSPCPKPRRHPGSEAVCRRRCPRLPRRVSERPTLGILCLINTYTSDGQHKEPQQQREQQRGEQPRCQPATTPSAYS
jgi:hypothetical protein